jgi:outer membrane protein insertion porin family
MCTDVGRRSTRGALLALAAPLLAIASGLPTRLDAQATLSLVNSETTVRSVRFRFLDHQTFSSRQLTDRIALAAPGPLEFLPLYSSGPFPFTPVELQRDLVRLRRFYQRSGYPSAAIDYAVTFDATANKVRVEFLIREGDPVVRGAISAVEEGAGAVSEALPEEVANDWALFLEGVTPGRGARLGELQRVQLEDRASGWLRNRGYPFAGVGSELQPDESTPNVVHVVLVVRLGQRARIGAIRVEGGRRLPERVITRELPFERGDWFSEEELSEGERELLALDLVRFALADVVAPADGGGASPDSTVDVRVRVEESLPRVIAGQVGYATEVGISGQTDWSHRDFLGGARTFTAALQARTGALALGTSVQRRYTASLSVKQPYFFGRRRSLVVTPQVEYRDDFRDRSAQAGGEAIVFEQWGPLRSVSLHLTSSRRRVFDFRLTGTEGFDFRRVLTELDTLDHDIRSSTVGVAGTLGNVDNAISPRVGYLTRATVELTGPSWVASAQYGRVEASVARFASFRPRLGVVMRLSAGRLFPFGRSVPARAEDRTLALLRLRDALFTAGGRYEVRGWGEQQLGPKYPDVRVDRTDPDTVLVARSYVPLGGLAKVTASAELRLPLPGAPSAHSTHVFLDGGRVWSPDERYRISGIGETAFRLSAGAGLELGTPVGPVRLSIGYKLNPSAFDVRDPQAVFTALSTGASVFDVSTEERRRWHLHLAIGHAF